MLTIRSFESDALDVIGTKYLDFLFNSFATLKKKKIQSLVIDLRGNGGGRDDYGSLLFAYLTSSTYRYYDYLEMKKPVYNFLKYTDQPDSYKDQIKNILIQRNDGKWIYKESAHPCLPDQTPQPNHFDNELFILIDGNSFSATAEFCSIARDRRRGLFVGEETGGAFEGNTSGGGVNLTLPVTRLRVRIPMTKYVCAVKLSSQNYGRGIVPDRIVIPTLQGMMAGTDEVMKQVRAFIK